MLNLKLKNKESILKSSIITYYLLVVGSTALFTVFFYCTQIYWLFTLQAVSLAVHIAWGIRSYKENYDNLLKVIPFYILFFSMLLFPFVLCIWKLGIYTGILWYALIPFGVKLYFCDGKLKNWTILCVLLVVAVLILQNYIRFDYELGKNQVIFFNSFNVAVCCACMCIFFYFIKLSHKNNNSQETAQVSEDKNSDEVTSETTTPDNNEESNQQQQSTKKFVSLFNRISEYFEKEKPYLDSDFSVAKLANDIDSNTNYITKAIRIQTGNNFNWYVNSFRIRYIQQLFVDENYRSYTIDHLRAKAGFKNQSTFNDTFKKQTGMTPSEYLEDLKIKRR
jgi:AraC-like DNA-binding protein